MRQLSKWFHSQILKDREYEKIDASIHSACWLVLGYWIEYATRVRTECVWIMNYFGESKRRRMQRVGRYVLVREAYVRARGSFRSEDHCCCLVRQQENLLVQPPTPLVNVSTSNSRLLLSTIIHLVGTGSFAHPPCIIPYKSQCRSPRLGQ